MIKIRPKEKNAIIESLKAGIVPRIGLQHIQVGRKDELQEIIKDFDIIKDGGAKTRFIIGEYGSGKTFFLTLAKLIAHEKNFVVISADITTEKVLCSTDGKAQSLFSELVSNMSVKTKPDGGALKTVIEKWASAIINKYGEISEDLIIKLLEPLDKYVSYYDFSKVLYTYIQSLNNDDEVMMNNALRWLRAEYSTKTQAKQDLNVKVIISDENFYDYIKLFAHFTKLAGYSGLIVNIDELAVLARLKLNARNKNLERILNIINDSLQGSAEYLEFIFGGTPEFLEDRQRGLYSYGALQSRLASNPFEKQGMKDLTGPVIKLDLLSQEELFVLFIKIRNIFADFDESKYLVNENDISHFMQWLYSHLGAESFLSPRNSIKSFIGLLSQLQNYPNTSIDDYIQSTDFINDDSDEDDEIQSLDF